MTCSCGQPAHPAYGDRCEDCWVAGSPSMSWQPFIIPQGRPEAYHLNGRHRSKRFLIESPFTTKSIRDKL